MDNRIWISISLVVFLAGMFVGGKDVEDRFKILGIISINKLEQMKNSCEKDLPRSQSCVINVSYKPQVVIKTKEEK